MVPIVIHIGVWECGVVQLGVNPPDTEPYKGHRPLRPGRTDVSLCYSFPTKATKSPIKMLLAAQQLLLFQSPRCYASHSVLHKAFVSMVFHLWSFECEWG